jgi:hypothetical protein
MVLGQILYIQEMRSTNNARVRAGLTGGYATAARLISTLLCMNV